MRKLLLGIIVLGILGFFQTASAAPSTTFSRNFFPETTGIYWNGTTTKSWRGIYANEFCLAGDCKTSWPSAPDDFTFESHYGEFTAATSSPMWIKGNLYASSSIRVGGNVTSSGHIYPATNNAVDLGAYDYAFKNIYASGTSYLGGANFTSPVTGISLDEIEDLTTDKIFTMAANNLTFNFTTPSDGLTLNATGAFNDHVLHVYQFTGNPSAGTQLVHLHAEDADVIPLNVEGAGQSSIFYNSGLSIGNGTVSTTISGNTLVSGAATGYDQGKFYIDSNGLISASSSIKTFGNVTSTGNIYGLSNAIITGNIGAGGDPTIYKIYSTGGDVKFSGNDILMSLENSVLGTAWVLKAGNTGKFSLFSNAAGAGIGNGINITSAGNFGLGTQTPGERLTVYNGNIAVTNSTTSTLGSDFFSIASSTSNRQGIFYIDSSGNVSASGSLYAFGNVTSTGNLYVGGDLNTDEFNLRVNGTHSIFSDDAQIETNLPIFFNSGFSPTGYMLSSLIPEGNNSLDLGALNNSFRNIYTSSTIYIGQGSSIAEISYKQIGLPGGLRVGDGSASAIFDMRAEAGGISYFRWMEGSTFVVNFNAMYSYDQMLLGLRPGVGSQLNITSNDFIDSDHDHIPQVNPTLYLQGYLNPNTSNNVWGSIHHNNYSGLTLTTGLETGAGTSPRTIDNSIIFSPRMVTSSILTGLGLWGMGTTTPQSELDIFSTASTTVTVDSNSASKGACLKYKDIDGGGYTYCSFLNGAQTCSMTSCE